MIPDTAFIIFAMLIVSCLPILPLFLQERPQPGDVALVVAAPWGNAAEIALKAEVQEVAPERAPLGVLVSLDSPQSVDRLYALGAWFVIDGKRVLELCAI